MGPIHSRPSFSDVVDIVQSALPHRSDRRVKPALETQTNKLCTDTPVLIARKRGKRRRFRTWKRNQIRNYTPCHNLEDNDDYANVFGRSRPDSAQSLPSAIPVRRYRPAFPTPTTLPSSEYRLFIENIEAEGRVIGSTFEEQSTCTATSRLSTGSRPVCCRHCRNVVCAPPTFSSSPCVTPLPHPTVRPMCRACAWHSLLPHDCGCFGPSGIEVLSWDLERGRFERELSTPIICPCGRPRMSTTIVQEHRTEHIIDSEVIFLDEPAPEQVPAEPVAEKVPEEELEPKTEPTEEIHPCVCALPSKKPCPCDKRLFEAMKPWSKGKLAMGGILVLFLIIWFAVFFWP